MSLLFQTKRSCCFVWMTVSGVLGWANYQQHQEIAGCVFKVESLWERSRRAAMKNLTKVEEALDTIRHLTVDLEKSDAAADRCVVELKDAVSTTERLLHLCPPHHGEPNAAGQGAVCPETLDPDPTGTF